MARGAGADERTQRTGSQARSHASGEATMTTLPPRGSNPSTGAAYACMRTSDPAGTMAVCASVGSRVSAFSLRCAWTGWRAIKGPPARPARAVLVVLVSLSFLPTHCHPPPASCIRRPSTPIATARQPLASLLAHSPYISLHTPTQCRDTRSSSTHPRATLRRARRPSRFVRPLSLPIRSPAPSS